MADRVRCLLMGHRWNRLLARWDNARSLSYLECDRCGATHLGALPPGWYDGLDVERRPAWWELPLALLDRDVVVTVLAPYDWLREHARRLEGRAFRLLMWLGVWVAPQHGALYRAGRVRWPWEPNPKFDVPCHAPAWLWWWR